MTDVQFRRLGDSGLKVSAVGLGCNNFGRRLDRDATSRVVHAALDCGITLFDTADVYGNGESEEFLGAALRHRREEVIVATKFGSAMGGGPYEHGGSARYVRRAAEASLKRLGREFIDLYQMHSPDPDTPLEETLSALNDLVREGKVRYIGSSNFSGWQIADAAWIARVRGWSPFISVQNHYSLLHRDIERDVAPACARFGAGILPYFPLASGLLTGKYSRGQPPPEGSRLSANPRSDRWLNDRNFDIVDGLQHFATERGIHMLDVAIGGLLAQPMVASVIAGATSPEQVEANVLAAQWSPAVEDLQDIDALTTGRDHG